MTVTRKITSRDNDQIKQARRVRDGREAGKIFLEGVRLVDEAARSRVPVESVFVSSEFLAELSADDLSAWLRPKSIFEVPEPVLESIADTNNPQGIIVIAKTPETGREKLQERAASTSPLVVFLHEINNPSNLGAVIRAAEGAGVVGVIVSDDSADPFSPKALRAAMGSSLRLPIWTDTSFRDAMWWAGKNGYRTVAADIKGSRSYTDIDWQIPRMLIFGSEAHGLDDELVEQIDELIVIPMEKDVESLNVAVACGVILFEARRQNSIR